MSKREGNVPALTPRERQVLVALCKPCLESDTFTEPSSIRDIAEELGVTQAAIKQHLLKLYEKFRLPDDGERRRVRLANDAIALGVVLRNRDGDLTPADAPPPSIRQGRSARAAQSWEAAYRSFAEADAAGALDDMADVEALGEAAWFSGHPQESIAARQRAYATYVERNASYDAARVAVDLAINYVTRASFAVAGGWLGKARRHLEGQPDRSEHGYLASVEAIGALLQGALDAALDRAHTARAIGERQREPDLVALAQAVEASVLARQGKLAESKSLFDEAMASASSGELGPFATGIVYCRTICTCLELFDHRRANEWTEAINECRRPHGPDAFPGDCRAHRAAILLHRGEWKAAADEARTACTETTSFDLNHTGLASYELGVAELRAGRFDAADEAFRRAHELGADPEPGMSMLTLARGEAASAATALRDALAQASSGPLRRARLLPVHIDASLATGDIEAARTSADELAKTARDYDSATLHAAVAFAFGRIAAKTGDLDQAAAKLHDSQRLWTSVDAPYEAARARLELGRALASAKKVAQALLELRAAAGAFERLGAKADLEAATVATQALSA